MLHGWGGDERSFANIVPFFGKHFRCLVPSMPMFQSADVLSPGKPWKLEDYADFIIKYLDEHKVEKCHILGHSFGCRVAALLAAYRPERFGRLVFTGAAGIRPRRKPNIVAKIWWHKTCRRLGVKRRKSAGSADYQKLTPAGKVTFQNILRRDVSDEITKVLHPTLLIFGKNDTATPPYLGRRWRRLAPDARLVIYERSGHFCYVDEAARFSIDTLNFLLYN